MLSFGSCLVILSLFAISHAANDNSPSMFDKCSAKVKSSGYPIDQITGDYVLTLMNEAATKTMSYSTDDKCSKVVTTNPGGTDVTVSFNYKAKPFNIDSKDYDASTGVSYQYDRPATFGDEKEVRDNEFVWVYRDDCIVVFYCCSLLDTGSDDDQKNDSQREFFWILKNSSDTCKTKTPDDIKATLKNDAKLDTDKLKFVTVC